MRIGDVLALRFDIVALFIYSSEEDERRIKFKGLVRKNLTILFLQCTYEQAEFRKANWGLMRISII